MTTPDYIKILELLGFQNYLGTYQRYTNVPFVGNVNMLCVEMQHTEKKVTVYFVKYHQEVTDKNRSRVRKHIERVNKKQLDWAREFFPELDSLAEVAHTLEVCP